MSRSLKIRSDLIEKAKLSLKRNGFRSQRALAEDSGLALSTVSNFLTGKSVDYATFVEICEKLRQDWQDIADLGHQSPSQPTTVTVEKVNPTPQQDWGEAIDVSVFYNRTRELAILKQWIVDEHCRLVAVLGMGGIGKTALSVKLAEQIQSDFDYIIWRSLRNAPPVEDLLANLLQFLGDRTETDLGQTFDEQLSRLIAKLRTSRCLLILDNAESILQTGDPQSGSRGEQARTDQAGSKGYAQLFKAVGETSHNSCVVLTSREFPKELIPLEGETLPVRRLKLTGLSVAEGRKIFQAKGTFTGSDAQWSMLIERYAGNPLALKIVAAAIRDFFEGDIASFLEFSKQDAFIFDELRDLLQQQFGCLTPLEQEVMDWIAVHREPVSLSELQADFAHPISGGELLQALAFLQRRSLIEKVAARFTQQPVVMEYATRELIERTVQEIVAQKFTRFSTHALVRATAKDYVRETQIRLILQPVIDKLLTIFSPSSLENCLNQSLSSLRGKSPQKIGYAAGNILNLLRQLQVDVSGYDLSQLTLWQANLQGMNLQNVNFSESDLSNSVFSETLDEVWSVALSQDGQRLATGDNDCKICLWQVQTGQQLLICKGHTNWVRSIAFSRDGQTLVSGSADRTVKLWDLKTGKCLRTFTGHHSEVYSVAFSPDDQTVVSGSTDQSVKQWDIKTGQCLKTFTGHDKGVFAIALSNDGNLLASGSGDQTVKVWDLRTGQCLNTCTGHSNWVLSVAFSPDAQTLFSCSPDHTVKQWDVRTGQCLKTFMGHKNWVLSVAVSPDGQTLVSGSGDQTVKLWDVRTVQCLNTFTGHNHGVFAVAFSGEGKTIASGSSDQTVRLWDSSSGQCLRTLAGHTNRVYSVAWSPDGQTLASGSFDASVRLWDVSTGQCFRTLCGHSKQVYSVAFSPDGQTLASGGGDRQIKLWDVKTGQCLRTLIGHENWIYSVAFSPDGQALASGSGDHTLKLWDVRTGQCLNTLLGHTTWIWSVVFSPIPPTPHEINSEVSSDSPRRTNSEATSGSPLFKGRHSGLGGFRRGGSAVGRGGISLGGEGEIIASGSGDQTVKLWNVSTGECLKTLSGHTNRVYSVAFSPDGQTLASGSFDHSIRLWNIRNGQCLQTLTGHSNGVYSVVFSPDGQTLASGSLDHTVRLWDCRSGQCIRTYKGHTNETRSIAFSPDGETLVSGSQDQTVKRWNVKTGNCIKTLKATKLYEGMNLTRVKGLTEGQKATLKMLGASARV